MSDLSLVTVPTVSSVIDFMWAEMLDPNHKIVRKVATVRRARRRADTFDFVMAVNNSTPNPRLWVGRIDW